MAAPAIAQDSKTRATTLGDSSDQLMGSELMKAAGAGNRDAVQALLQKGADVNEKSGGLTERTALMKAAQNGHLEIVRLLINKGADVNLEDNGGTTALMYAAGGGYADIVRLLLEKGARIDKNGNGVTALMYAAKNGHADIVRLLLVKGTDVNAIAAGTGTALMDAANKGQTEIVRLLLEKGAKVNVNVNGTALMFAAREGYIEIVRVLLQKGADLNAKDSVGYTALSLAETRGQTEVVRLLKAAANEKPAVQTQAPRETIKDSPDMEVLNQLQPPATALEKKFFQQAKSKNEIPQFMATRKYMRLLKARFGNKELDAEDLKKAPPAADISDDYVVDFAEQLQLFNIKLSQGIEKGTEK
jgi:ankyrin repeat protein